MFKIDCENKDLNKDLTAVQVEAIEAVQQILERAKERELNKHVPASGILTIIHAVVMQCIGASLEFEGEEIAKADLSDEKKTREIQHLFDHAIDQCMETFAKSLPIDVAPVKVPRDEFSTMTQFAEALQAKEGTKH